MFGFSLKIASGRSTSPLRSPSASKKGACMLASDLPRIGFARRALGLDLLGGLTDEDEGALRARHAAPDQEQVALRIDSHDSVRAGGCMVESYPFSDASSECVTAGGVAGGALG